MDSSKMEPAALAKAAEKSPHAAWALRGFDVISVCPGVPLNGDKFMDLGEGRKLAPGKTPAIFHADVHAWGAMRGWQAFKPTLEDLKRWGKHGANVGVRKMHGIDSDVDDRELAREVKDAVVDHFTGAPLRFRRGSPRFFAALRPGKEGPVSGGVITIYKDQAALDARKKMGAVEISGTARQTVVEGTHHTGERIVWDAPGFTLESLPPMDLDVLQAFAMDVKKRIEAMGYIVVIDLRAITAAVSKIPSVPASEDDYDASDKWPRVSRASMEKALAECSIGRSLRDRDPRFGFPRGKAISGVYCTCPNAAGHSKPDARSSTMYRPGGLPGDDGGPAFRCLHAGCVDLDTTDFIEWALRTYGFESVGGDRGEESRGEAGTAPPERDAGSHGQPESGENRDGAARDEAAAGGAAGVVGGGVGAKESPQEKLKSRLLGSFVQFTGAQLRSLPPPIQFLLAGYIPAGVAGSLSGPGGIGKTAFLIGLMFHRALGLPFLGRATLPGASVLITKEDRPLDIHHKMVAWRLAMGEGYDWDLVARKVTAVSLVGDDFSLLGKGRRGYTTSDATRAMADVIFEKAPSADLIAVDTISRMGGDESNEAMSALVTAAEYLGQARSATVILNGHVSKAVAKAGSVEQHSGRGGGALGDNGRFEMVLARLVLEDGEEDERLMGVPPELLPDICTFNVPKMNSAKWSGSILLVREGHGAHIAGPTFRALDTCASVPTTPEMKRESRGRRFRQVVEELVAAGEKPTKSSLKELHRTHFKITRTKFPQALAEALTDKFIQEGDRVSGGHPSFIPGERL